jgi:ketosteroid isomerase-like protein
MSTTLEAEITAAEAQRCAAMVANDPAALAQALDDDLQFHHATGTVDDKAAFLAKMAAGRIRYAAISWSEDKVLSLGPDTALLTGRMTTDVQVEGVDKRLNNRVMTIWRRSAESWRLLAFQSTPIAG